MTTATISRQAQAEALLIELDAVQSELEMASTQGLFERCKVQLVEIKAEIEALGFQVERCVTGWKLVEQVAEVAQVASQPQVALHEDEQGLYASIPSSTGRCAYTVRVCAKWLYSVSCDCAARGDCKHRVQIDRAFDAVRPTFSEQCAGVSASREVIARLVTPSRYAIPLKGSGVTGFRAAAMERKLAA